MWWRVVFLVARWFGGEMTVNLSNEVNLRGKILTSVNIPHNDSSILEPQGHIRTAFTYDTDVNLF